MKGAVDNGEMVEVTIGRLTVNTRVRIGGPELAYVGKAPARFPMKITVGGREITATASRKSDVKGMAVLIVDWSAE